MKTKITQFFMMVNHGHKVFTGVSTVPRLSDETYDEADEIIFSVSFNGVTRDLKYEDLIPCDSMGALRMVTHGFEAANPDYKLLTMEEFMLTEDFWEKKDE